MAFQTHVQQNGQWVSQTVDLQAALSATNITPRAPPQLLPLSSNSPHGLLRRTIVHSSAVLWILPVQLRSSSKNDVALVGENYIEIREFSKDRQLHHVVGYQPVLSGIRNARVLGLGQPLEKVSAVSGSGHYPEVSIKTDPAEEGKASRLSFPPQMLVLALECGDLLFLFIRERGPDDLEVVESRFELRPSPNIYPGFHLTVDPSSRYMASGTAEGLFVVYELESIETLQDQHSATMTFQPVRNYYPRGAQGVIHKMEFLHPDHDDPDTIILLLIVVRNGKSKIVVYEWRAGCDLGQALRGERSGYTLPTRYSLPLLVIPLTVRSSFLAVSQDSVAVFKDISCGSAAANPLWASMPTLNLESVEISAPGPTEFHHGLRPPLWTCWARPYRREDYRASQDNIYLAREDGAVIFFEINSIDILAATVQLGAVNCAVSTAFTAVQEHFGDVLIVGGESGSGSVWQINARQDMYQLATIPNWSQALDLVIVDYEDKPIPTAASGSPYGQAPPTLTPTETADGQAAPKQAAVFSTSGRDPNGTVTEYRVGLAADVKVALDYGESLRRAWFFTVNPTCLDLGFYILLGLPDCSALLRLSGDLSEAEASDADTSQFDLRSRTLAATQRRDGSMVQITETSTTFICDTGSQRHLHSAKFPLGGGTVENAVIYRDTVVIASHAYSLSCLYVGKIGANNLFHTLSANIDKEPTCLCVCHVAGHLYVLVGHGGDGVPSISAVSLRDGTLHRMHIYNAFPDTGQDMTAESLTSIVMIEERVNGTRLAVGTRSGHVIAITVSPGPPLALTDAYTERLGPSAVEVLPAAAFPTPFGYSRSIMACCDSKLILLTDVATRLGARFRFKIKHRIIPVDSNSPNSTAPKIDWALCLRNKLPTRSGYPPLLALVGQVVLLADVNPHPQMVPRTLPVAGTPTKLIYSKSLNCLIVATQKKTRSTILFIDPETGKDLSQPEDSRTRLRQDFVTGLGEYGDPIRCLYEWHYVKDGRMFVFIVVTTSQGRLVVVSAEPHQKTNGRSVRFYTRYRRKASGESIHAVTGDKEGLVYCMGSVLHWVVLDLAGKTLRHMGRYSLDSPATSLQVGDGMIYALTTDHSLLAIKKARTFSTAAGEQAAALAHADVGSRKTMHMINLPGIDNSIGPDWILSDRHTGVAGVHVPLDRPGAEFEVLFGGCLPSSIRRFRRGRTRPFWSEFNRDRLYGRLETSPADSEIWGVGLDGSLQHFTPLGAGLWRILSLIQVQALSYPTCIGSPPSHLTQHGAGPDHVWRAVHVRSEDPTTVIDGEILYRIYCRRLLEQILGHDDAFTVFCVLVCELDSGAPTVPIQRKSRKEAFYALGYSLLEYVLSPVL